MEQITLKNLEDLATYMAEITGKAIVVGRSGGGVCLFETSEIGGLDYIRGLPQVYLPKRKVYDLGRAWCRHFIDTEEGK
jgi:hypothetical protein